MPPKKTAEKEETVTPEEVPGQMGLEQFVDPDSELPIDNPPPTDNPVIIALFPQIKNVCEGIDSAQEIIDANDLTEEGIKKNAETSENEKIVSGRKIWQDLGNEIARLERELEDAREKRRKEWQSLLVLSRAEMESNLDKEAVEKAKEEKKVLVTKLNSFATTIRLTEPDHEWKNYLSKIQAEYAPSFTSPSRARAGRAASAKRKEWSAECRAWLKAQGHDLNDRGRIPEELRAEYINATGNYPPKG